MTTLTEHGVSIEEAAERTGVSPHTLRYYERIGLLAPITRGPGGHHRFTDAGIDAVVFLTLLRQTGMPIRDMQRFIEGPGPASSCGYLLGRSFASLFDAASAESAAMKASCGTSTRPMVFIRFLPSFCFSSSLRLRVMSPP